MSSRFTSLRRRRHRTRQASYCDYTFGNHKTNNMLHGSRRVRSTGPQSGELAVDDWIWSSARNHARHATLAGHDGPSGGREARCPKA